MATLPRIGLLPIGWPVLLRRITSYRQERRDARALQRDLDRLGALSTHLLDDIGMVGAAMPAPHVPPVHTGRSVA